MTRRTAITVFAAVTSALLLPPVTSGQRAATAVQARASTPVRDVPAYQRFLSPASPLELVAAKKVDRVAWTSFEESKRNAYTAAPPSTGGNHRSCWSMETTIETWHSSRRPVSCSCCGSVMSMSS